MATNNQARGQQVKRYTAALITGIIVALPLPLITGTVGERQVAHVALTTVNAHSTQEDSE
jgi:hypothetical protein